MLSMAVICKSLRNRDDRRKKARQVFEILGLNVHWWIVDKHPISGVLGSFESDFHILNSNEFDNYQYLMICEDDIELTESGYKNFKDVIQYIPSYLDTSIFNL